MTSQSARWHLSNISPDSIWWLYLLSGLWNHNLPDTGRWQILFFEQLFIFQTLSDGYIFVFQTMISQFTHWWMMTTTLFWTTLIFPDSIWWLCLFSRLWYHNLPADRRRHANANFSRLCLMVVFFSRLWYHNLPAGRRRRPTLIFPDSIWWFYLFSRLWYHNLPTGRRRHPLHGAQHELQCCWLPGMDFFFFEGVFSSCTLWKVDIALGRIRKLLLTFPTLLASFATTLRT
jgi:hypothetical protein